MLEHYEETALGLVSTRSFPAIVGTADMMLKSANVHLVGYERIGSGYCTAVVRGKTPDVRLAVAAGVETAEKFGQLVSSLVLPRPLPNLEAVLPIGSLLAQLVEGHTTEFTDQAIGLLETRGFPAMVGAADAMVKAAEVYFSGYQTIGAGLCTAIIRGHVSSVIYAIEAGMQEAERIGELHAVMVIPRPMEDMEHTLPAMVERQPLRLPITVKEMEREALNLTARQAQTLLVPPQ
ncbi:carbon dioxide-concentrating mechanism protein [Anthocerotibacter panamensis]|uniref:carbon dioxide-concentrating mechanism protein n=1 Tax=Anthocerotibacter panamensis TaxID=2857077 RepID=UPI001C40505B